MNYKDERKWSPETWQTAQDMRQPLRNYATRLTGDPDAGEDIVQQAYVKLQRQESNGAEEPRNIEAVMKTAIKTLAIDAHRSRKVRGGTHNHGIHDAEAYENIFNGLRSDDPHPDDEIYRKQLSGFIHEALANKPEFLKAYQLLYEQGLTNEEAAEVAGVPVGTMKSWSSRFKTFLQGNAAFCEKVGMGKGKDEPVAAR